jgi:zinc protease
MEQKMKKYFIFMLLLSAASTGFTGAANPDPVRSFTLDNGLRVVLAEKPQARLINMALSINLGSKDESDETSGFVHILEHVLLYGGSKNLSPERKSRKIRENGLLFNAHTDHDLMTFDISFPGTDCEWLFNFFKEVWFEAELSPLALENEKKVILEEINQIQDSPEKIGTTLLLQNLFSGHPYGRTLFGKPETIEKANVEKLTAFYKKYVVPGNCVLSLVGNISSESAEKDITRIFGDLKKTDCPESIIAKASPPAKSRELNLQMDIQQAHLILGFMAPDYNHPDQAAMTVLTQVLGRGFNPFLGRMIRGNNRLADNISISYLPMKLGGALIMYLTLEPKNLNAVKRELNRLLKAAAHFQYSKNDFPAGRQMGVWDYLESAMNQIKLNTEQFKETGLQMAVNYSRSLHLSDNLGKAGFFDRLEKIESSDLRKAAGKYVSGKKAVMVAILPKNNK